MSMTLTMLNQRNWSLPSDWRLTTEVKHCSLLLITGSSSVCFRRHLPCRRWERKSRDRRGSQIDLVTWDEGTVWRNSLKDSRRRLTDNESDTSQEKRSVSLHSIRSRCFSAFLCTILWTVLFSLSLSRCLPFVECGREKSPMYAYHLRIHACHPPFLASFLHMCAGDCACQGARRNDEKMFNPSEFPIAECRRRTQNVAKGRKLKREQKFDSFSFFSLSQVIFFMTFFLSCMFV